MMCKSASWIVSAVRAPGSESSSGTIRNIYSFDGRQQLAILPVPGPRPLFGNEAAHVIDFDNRPLSVSFQSRPAQAQLDRAAFALFAGRQMIVIPLEPHVRSFDRRIPLRFVGEL